MEVLFDRGETGLKCGCCGVERGALRVQDGVVGVEVDLGIASIFGNVIDVDGEQRWA